MLASRQVDSTSYPVFSNNLGRQRGKEAWTNNLALASLAASKVSSCLGPEGAYKLVAYHRGPELVTKVTKDPVDIVDELGVQYPAIKTLAEAVKIHREQAGDGSCTLVALLAALLQEAEKLMEVGIHPVAIVDGYKEAAKKSVAIVDEISRKFYGDLEGSLLKTVDSGRGLLKTLGQSLSHAVGLAEGPGGIDLHGIRIEKKLGGAIEESGLIEGVVIKHWKAHPSMPDQIDLPRVALVNKRMEVKPFEQVAKGEGPFPARLNVTDAQQLRQFIVEESTLRSSMVERVKSSGANLLICRSRIEERVADKLSRQGIFALEKVDQNILDEIARATGARIVGDVNLLEKDDVGTARKLELDKIPPERIAILHCNGAATILLRGGSPELVQELEKVVRRALLVLKHARNNSQVVPGGGAIFAKLSHRLREHALSFSGRQQLGIKAFANALETIPRCLAINYGLDAINIMAQLRASHSRGLESTGVGCEGCLDMLDAGVVELSAIVKTTIWRTFEIASLLLKIDDYFYVKDLPVIHKQ